MKPNNTLLTSDSRFCFHYSFLFKKLPLSDKIPEGEGRSYGQEIAQKLLKAYSLFEFHLAEEDEPIEQRSDVYLLFPHFSISTIGKGHSILRLGKSNPNREISCKVSTHIALFESGMGVARIEIGVGCDLATDDVTSLCSLGDNSPECVLAVEGMDTSPFELFNKEIESLRENLNSAFKAICGDSGMVLHKVEWIEKDQGFVRSEVDAGHANFQKPHVLSLLSLPSRLFSALSSSGRIRETIETTLLQVLMQNRSNHLSHEFKRQYIGEHLITVYPDPRFLVFMYGRSVLVCHDASNRPRDDEAMNRLMKGLFRTVVALRGAWHFYLITNECIDHTIKSLFAQFERLLQNETISAEDLTRKEQEIVRVRGEFLQNLAVEDPLVRSICLGSFGQIYERGMDTYRSAELRELVWRKLDELDRLHDLVGGYRLMIKYEVVPTRVGKKLRLSWGTLAAVVACLFIAFYGVYRLVWGLFDWRGVFFVAVFLLMAAGLTIQGFLRKSS